MQNSAAVTMPFTGDSRMRSMLGTALLALCGLPLSVVAAAHAQNPVTNGVRAVAQRQTKNIVEAAEEMPADKYGYKPTPAQMSFGDVVAHLIKEGNNYLCSAASGMKQPDADKFSGTDPKDKLVAGGERWAGGGAGRRRRRLRRQPRSTKLCHPEGWKRGTGTGGASRSGSISGCIKLGGSSSSTGKPLSTNGNTRKVEG